MESSMAINEISQLTGKTILKAIEYRTGNGNATCIVLEFAGGESISISFWDMDGGWESPSGYAGKETDDRV
jgi:hypothetical protein